MPRLAGIDIPSQKPLKVSLTYIYGIGRRHAAKIIQELKLNPDLPTAKLTSAQIQALTQKIDTFPVEGDLKKMVRDNIQRLRRIGAYRGLRHSAGLPTRGQRTRTNARTNRGKRRTVGALTKEQRQKVETPSN